MPLDAAGNGTERFQGRWQFSWRCHTVLALPKAWPAIGKGWWTIWWCMMRVLTWPTHNPGTLLKRQLHKMHTAQ